jgi:hypothetical protein
VSRRQGQEVVRVVKAAQARRHAEKDASERLARQII